MPVLRDQIRERPALGLLELRQPDGGSARRRRDPARDDDEPKLDDRPRGRAHGQVSPRRDEGAKRPGYGSEVEVAGLVPGLLAHDHVALAVGDHFLDLRQVVPAGRR